MLKGPSTRIAVFVALGAFLVGLASQPAAATVIDFEEFSPPVGSFLNFSPSFSSQGFTFGSPGSLFLMHNDQPNAPNSGFNTLQSSTAANFTLTESSGAAFDLTTLLISEGRNTTTGFFNFSATSVRLDGTFAGGGTITTTFALDLFAQENDLLDFESFAPTGFVGLTSVTFTGLGGVSGNSFQLDDLAVNLTVVPEPATLLLFGTGLAGLAGLRRRRKVH